MDLLACNSAKRIRRSDLFMLLALWMEHRPSSASSQNHQSQNHQTHQNHQNHRNHQNHQNQNHQNQYASSLPPPLPTGAVLVDPKDRVIALDRTGQAHAAVRCLLSAACDIQGCDVYVSRFPCCLCVKVMVQAGIRKIYYFPAEQWELANPMCLGSREEGVEKREKNRKSVARLVANNPIAMTLFIPQWDHGDLLDTYDLPDEEDFDTSFPDMCQPQTTPPTSSSTLSPQPQHSSHSRTHSSTKSQIRWPIDPAVGTHPGITNRWPTIQRKFERTCTAISLLVDKFSVDIGRWTHGSCIEGSQRIVSMGSEGGGDGGPDRDGGIGRLEVPDWGLHAMVLAHIAARRTDDPKLGVGSVLIVDGRYVSVGWNGYPKKCQHLDYPQAGADDSVEDEELKYDYILHSEQNALLWRNPPGSRIENGWLACTKMPCDECSPMLHDCGIKNVLTIPQIPKSHDDPARLRGLTYDRVHGLMDQVLVFKV